MPLQRGAAAGCEDGRHEAAAARPHQAPSLPYATLEAQVQFSKTGVLPGDLKQPALRGAVYRNLQCGRTTEWVDGKFNNLTSQGYWVHARAQFDS